MRIIIILFIIYLALYIMMQNVSSHAIVINNQHHIYLSIYLSIFFYMRLDLFRFIYLIYSSEIITVCLPLFDIYVCVSVVTLYIVNS